MAGFEMVSWEQKDSGAHLYPIQCNSIQNIIFLHGKLVLHKKHDIHGSLVKSIELTVQIHFSNQNSANN